MRSVDRSILSRQYVESQEKQVLGPASQWCWATSRPGLLRYGSSQPFWLLLKDAASSKDGPRLSRYGSECSRRLRDSVRSETGRVRRTTQHRLNAVWGCRMESLISMFRSASWIPGWLILWQTRRLDGNERGQFVCGSPSQSRKSSGRSVAEHWRLCQRG